MVQRNRGVRGIGGIGGSVNRHGGSKFYDGCVRDKYDIFSSSSSSIAHTHRGIESWNRPFIQHAHTTRFSRKHTIDSSRATLKPGSPMRASFQGVQTARPSQNLTDSSTLRRRCFLRQSNPYDHTWPRPYQSAVAMGRSAFRTCRRCHSLPQMAASPPPPPPLSPPIQTFVRVLTEGSKKSRPSRRTTCFARNRRAMWDPCRGGRSHLSPHFWQMVLEGESEAPSVVRESRWFEREKSVLDLEQPRLTPEGAHLEVVRNGGWK